MKNFIRLTTTSILIGIALFISPFLYGQADTLFWRTTGNTIATTSSTNKLGTLGANANLNIYAGGVQRTIVLGTNGFVGIGNNFTSPVSLLHINAFGNSVGCLFRTDGDNTKLNMWQLFTGSSVATTKEIFRLSVPGNTSNVLFDALHAGNIQFKTGSITRFFIQNDTSQEAFHVAGNIGIGTNFIDPLRKLDVFDNSGAPQFRISYNLARNKRTVSEFQTTRSGDMIFTNHDSLGNLGKFGFQTVTPGNTVEINSVLASSTTSNSITAAPDFKGNATGRSGLRFTDLNSSSIPQLNPGKGILTVDANGDVIYVPSVKTGANNGICDSAGIAQLGASCSDSLSIAKTGFTKNRVVNQNNKVLEFRNGWIGFGTNNSCSSGKPFHNRVVIAGLSRNQSGLTFDSLNAGSPVIPNGTNGVTNSKVLTLDNTGKVVLTDAKTGVSVAQYDSTITALKNSIASLQTANIAMHNQLNQLATLINSCCSATDNHHDNDKNNCDDKNKHNQKGNNYDNYNENCKKGNVNYRSGNSNTSNFISIDLKDLQTVVLEQNVPNPFVQQTTIDYFLPDNVEKAQILFYNMQGKLIHAVDLMQKGKGSIIVFAQDLSSGVYSYMLVADGQITQSKKMIKQ